MCTTLNHFKLHLLLENKSYSYNFTSVFPLEKKDEPEGESKDETKDERTAEPDKAEPDKVFIIYSQRPFLSVSIKK